MQLDGKRGSGRFQWNRGGWFGSQLGATLWLVLLGGLLLGQGQPVGAPVAGLGLLPNLVGVHLWRRRWSVSPYPAIQALVASAGASAVVAMGLLWASGVAPLSFHPRTGFGFLAVYPGLMLLFHLQESAARKIAP